MVKELAVGQRLRVRCGVVSVEEKTTAKGDPFLILELSCPEETFSGKVWSQAMPMVKVKPGQVVELELVAESYRGAPQYIVSQATQLPEEEFEKYLCAEKMLVFDIETAGKPFDELDETDQDYLMNNLEKKFEGTDEQRKDRTGLYPLFGFVVTIGMYAPNKKEGMVFYLDNIKNQKLKIKNMESFASAQDKSATQWEESPDDNKQLTIDELEIKKQTKNEELKTKNHENDFVYQGFEDEKSMLEAFWKKAEEYEKFVTYNGTGFDWPFLVFRSAVNRVKVPFETRGGGDKFVDLAQKIQMNFRAFKLEQVCKAFGITNPKQDGVSGMEVARLYREGKLADIVEYVGRDVMATAELYNVWRKYMAGKAG